MKKTQFALAALALVASSAALADGVTIYGVVDASLTTGNSGFKTSMDGSGNWNGTNWGIKGTEDLGAGLKVGFNLEQGVNIANGATANGGTAGMYNRQANVDVSGSFGTVKAGLQTSPFISAALNGVANANESFYVPMLLVAGGGSGAMTAAGGSESAATGGFFIPGAISYTSPNMSGVTVSALWAPEAAISTNKYMAAMASYVTGPFSLAAGYQDRGDGTDGYTGSTFTAAYAASAELTVTGGVHSLHTKDTTNDVKAYNLGASYKLAPNMAVSLQFARNNGQTEGGDHQSIVNAGLQYTLSKSTYLYGTVSNAKNGALALYSGNGSSTDTSVTAAAVGIVKAF